VDRSSSLRDFLRATSGRRLASIESEYRLLFHLLGLTWRSPRTMLSRAAMDSPKKTPPASSELGDLVARMQHLKDEHTPLLTKIKADAGMSAEVRAALLEHLNQEEDELAAKIAALSPAMAAEVRRPASASRAVFKAPRFDAKPAATKCSGSLLTVGSLRQQALAPRTYGPPSHANRLPRLPGSASLSAAASRSSIGSLRNR